jgi:hypothetical protein
MPDKKIRERYKRFPVRIRLSDWIVLNQAGIPATPLIRELVTGYISRDPRLRDLKTYLEGNATGREATAPTPQGAGDPAPGRDQVQDVPHPPGSSLDFQDQDFQDQDQVDQDQVQDPVQVRDREPRVQLSTIPLIDTL